jgi:glycosyltransferase involved in cell wall biosynthesis
MNRLRKTEKEIVSQADLNLVVSQAISDALPDGHKLVILNGYEPRDFEGLKHNDSPFLRIKYVGQITAGQDIGLFAELFENLEREYRLYMIGTRLTQDEETKLRQACHDRLMIKSFVPHQEAVKEMVDSDILLLIINRLEGNQGILTTKLFEYLASRTPILCLGPPDTAAATIIRECEAGQNFDYHEIPEARKWLEQLPIQQRTTGNIELYSVESQSDILLSAMQSKIGVDK